MRAYLSKDADLFEGRRCRQSCEGRLDPAIAYDHFLGYVPQPLEVRANHRIQFASPTRIEKVFPSPLIPMSEELAAIRRFDLLLDYGAVESKFFDIITVADGGHRYITRVEAIHIGKHADDNWSKLTPTGTWQARIIRTPVAHKSGNGRPRE